MTTSHHQSFVNRRVLKINVGFLLAEGVGYQRTIELELPRIRLDEDLELEFLRGNLRLSRNSRGILAQGILDTQVLTECGRCLTPTFHSFKFEIGELFSYPPSSDTVYSVPETAILDLAPLMREEVILAVPMGALCRPDCAGLCSECGQNLNDAVCDCDRNVVDPRFAALSAHLKHDEELSEFIERQVRW